jgi:hypothetical protein
MISQASSIVEIPTFTNVTELGSGFALDSAVAPDTISPMAVATRMRSPATVEISSFLLMFGFR